MRNGPIIGCSLEVAAGRASTLQARANRCLGRRHGLACVVRRVPAPSREDAPVVKVGVLTGGGDCPGLNAVIRAVARRCFSRGHEVVGIRAGWRGLVDGRVVEVMGRHTGWIAVMSGIAGGADVILIPEHPISIEEACDDIRRRHERGKDFSIVVVSEGYELEGLADRGDVDEYGHVRLSQRGVGEALAREIEARTGFETRVTVLGHVQRGGSPTPRDRVLASRYGLKAADLVHEGRFGRMAALQGDRVVDVSLADATAELKTVPPEWYEVARAFFG